MGPNANAKNVNPTPIVICSSSDESFSGEHLSASAVAVETCISSNEATTGARTGIGTGTGAALGGGSIQNDGRSIHETNTYQDNFEGDSWAAYLEPSLYSPSPPHIPLSRILARSYSTPIGNAPLLVLDSTPTPESKGPITGDHYNLNSKEYSGGGDDDDVCDGGDDDDSNGGSYGDDIDYFNEPITNFGGKSPSPSSPSWLYSPKIAYTPSACSVTSKENLPPAEYPSRPCYALDSSRSASPSPSSYPSDLISDSASSSRSSLSPSPISSPRSSSYSQPAVALAPATFSAASRFGQTRDLNCEPDPTSNLTIPLLPRKRRAKLADDERATRNAETLNNNIPRRKQRLRLTDEDRAAREEERQNRRVSAQLNKKKHKLEYVKELHLHVHPDIEQNFSAAAQIIERITSLGCGFSRDATLDPHGAYFRRVANCRFCPELQSWVPTTAPVVTDESPRFLMYDAKDLCQLLRQDPHFLPSRSQVGDGMLVVLLHGADAWTRRDPGAASALEIVYDWRMFHDIHVVATQGIDDLGLTVESFALEIASLPYSRAIFCNDDFCEQLRVPSSSNLAEAYRLLLVRIKGVTAGIAESIAHVYPTYRCLHEALVENAYSLENLIVDRGIGNTSRRLGPTVSRRIYAVLMGSDPEQKV